MLRDRVALALGRTLALFSEREGWKDHGYARQSDYAREKLGRSSRWLREMARLGSAVERYPRLSSVLTGEDGGIPLGVAATLEIAAVADAESKLSAEATGAHDRMEIWIERARNFCLRQLRADAASAKADARREAPALSRKAICLGFEGVVPARGETGESSGALAAPGETAGQGKTRGKGETGAQGETGERGETGGQGETGKGSGAAPGTPERNPEESGEAADGAPERARRYTVRLGLPPEAAAAFEEVLDLHRAVSGGEATVSSFIEALVAEYRAGPDAAALGIEGSGAVAGIVPGGGQDARRPGTASCPEGLCSAAGGGQAARRPGAVSCPEADEELDLDDQLWMKLQQRKQERAAEREARLAKACDHWKQWPQDGAAVLARIAEHKQARALLEEIGRLVEEATRGIGPEGMAASGRASNAGVCTESGLDSGTGDGAEGGAASGPESNGMRSAVSDWRSNTASGGQNGAAGGAESDTTWPGSPRFFTGSSETDAVMLHRRVRRLMAADRRIEILLGELLASMADRRAWGRCHPAPWRFDNIAHYAEERLAVR